MMKKQKEKQEQFVYVINTSIRFIYRMEDSILVVLFMLMMCLTLAQIFLRNFFESGIIWGDVLVRILVLWIGLAGAMVASRQDRHINIDIITRYLPKRARKVAGSMVALFTAGICAVAAHYSFQFVQMEFEDGGKAYAQVPTWVCEAIIPFAFIVISLRYLILSVSRLWEALCDR
ncbi:TRAP transporter small permease [Desulfococcaceae bacterium HSG8]|nr:TRAP transporter small permease [Desulfococcaceae bacterium HSG8]